MREGCLLAHNLLRVLQARPTRAFHHKPLGATAAIGHMKGVAQALRGLPARLLWRPYCLSQMPTLGRKMRIFVERT